MSDNKRGTTSQEIIAQAVRKACIVAAKEGFQDASISGLCTEGAIEAAIGAMQSLDLKKVVAKAHQGGQ